MIERDLERSLGQMFDVPTAHDEDSAVLTGDRAVARGVSVCDRMLDRQTADDPGGAA